MQIFGVLLIIIVLYILLSKKSNDSFIWIWGITILVEINNISGYFFKIGSFEVAYTDFMQVVLAFVALPKLNRINKKHMTSFMWMIVCCSVGALQTLLFRPEIYVVDTYKTSWDALLFYKNGSKTLVSIGMHTLMIEARLILWGVIGLRFFHMQYGYYRKLTSIILSFSKIHIIYGFFEFITKTFLFSNIATEIRNVIFGLGDSTYSTLATRGLGSGFAIYGFTRESSHFAASMFLIAFILLVSKSYKTNKMWFVASLLLMSISMSFSSIMYIITLVVSYVYVERININIEKVFLVLGGLIILGIGTVKVVNNAYYGSRIAEFSKAIQDILGGEISNNITSSKVRLYSISESIKVCFLRPLFGVGLGATACYSSVVSIMVNVGAFGMLSWLKYCFRSVIDIRLNRKRTFITVVVFLMPYVFKGGLGLMYSVYIYYIIRMIYDAVLVTDEIPLSGRNHRLVNNV